MDGVKEGGEALEEGEIDRSTWDSMANWTQAERDYWFMGPFDGGLPGMIRRIRRILDVSQRGLAALLKVSQSVVARWETGRTSPRACVARTHAGIRYPRTPTCGRRGGGFRAGCGR